MIEFDCEEVKRQFNRLHELYPDDNFDIWVKWENKKVAYTVFLNCRGDLRGHNQTGDDLIATANVVIAEAGPRDGGAKIRAKRKAIEKARAELLKLESELDPLVMAVDEAAADNQSTNQPST